MTADTTHLPDEPKGADLHSNSASRQEGRQWACRSNNEWQARQGARGLLGVCLDQP